MSIQQIKNPKNQLDALKPMIEGIGGKIVACYYTFGKRHHCPDADGRRREGVEEGRHRALRPTEVAFGLRPDRPAPTEADPPEAESAA